MQTTSRKVKDSKGIVLLVTSSEDTLILKDGTTSYVGYYLNELAVPMQAVVDAGYEIVLATPKGNKPVMDPESADTGHFRNNEGELKKALEFVESYPAMQKPKTLQSVVENGLDEYVGIFIPGGHPPLIDLMQDPMLGVILRHFHSKGKTSCFLCHGPISVAAAMPDAISFRAALVEGNAGAAKKAAAGWQYAGYRMTIFTNDEEHYAEKNMFHGHLAPFYVADAMRIAGANVEMAEGGIFKPLVIEDRELITGQNPPSDHELAGVFVNALERYTARKALDRYTAKATV